MTEKNNTWRSTTTTRSWTISSGLSSEHRDAIEALRGAGLGDGARVSEQWRYAGDDGDGPFNVEIKDGSVTVNGRRYDSLDEVPREERERIEALRNGLAHDGLWDTLREAGLDIGGLMGADAPTSQAKPEFIMETDIPDVRDAAPAGASAAASGVDASAPGAVPRGGSGLRRIVLVAVVVGLAWWVLRATGAA